MFRVLSGARVANLRFCPMVGENVRTMRGSWGVRGHEKVPTGGQVEVPTGGQIKVPPVFVVSIRNCGPRW
jgi:hypothetical protein